MNKGQSRGEAAKVKVGERRLTFFFSTFQTRSWFVMRTGEKKGCQQADD